MKLVMRLRRGRDWPSLHRNKSSCYEPPIPIKAAISKRSYEKKPGGILQKRSRKVLASCRSKLCRAVVTTEKMENCEAKKMIFEVVIFLLLLGDVSSQSSSDSPIFSSCGSDITVNRGRITSPNYPSNYGNSLMCGWSILTQIENIPVKITITDIDIENARNCQYDSLAIRFTSEAEQKFCSTRVDGKPLEGSSPVAITFTSDGSVGGKGFSLSFEGSAFDFSSFNARTCRLQIRVNDVDIWETDACDNDFLALLFRGKDGKKYRICGTNPGPTRNTTGPGPVVVFLQTDKRNTSRGFSLDFEVLSPCLSEPCMNGGTCNYSNPDTYSCMCAPGWKGEQCQTEINECLSSPCRNGGTCVDEVNSFVCTCTPGVTGTTCDVIEDDCLHLRPCRNGGTCVKRNATYKCLCAEGYTGRNCDAEANECDSNPCQNGGSCIDQFASFSCSCDNNYTGDLCQTAVTTTTAATTTAATTTAPTTTASATTSIGEASTAAEGLCSASSSLQCANGGSCAVLNQVREVCMCPDGYSGERCEAKDKDSRAYLYALIGTSICAFLCLLFMSVILCFVLCKKSSTKFNDNTHLDPSGDADDSRHTSPRANFPPVRDAWSENSGKPAENNCFQRKMDQETMPHDNAVPRMAPQHPFSNGYYPHVINRYPINAQYVGTPDAVEDKTRHAPAENTTNPPLDAAAVYSLVNALKAIKDKGQNSQQKPPRKQSGVNKVTIAPTTATTLIDYLLSALRNNQSNHVSKPKATRVRFVDDESDVLKSVDSSEREVTNRSRSPRHVAPAFDQTKRAAGKPSQRYRFRPTERENSVADEVEMRRMQNLKVYNYFDQFASDKNGRSVMRLTRENAFMFE